MGANRVHGTTGVGTRPVLFGGGFMPVATAGCSKQAQRGCQQTGRHLLSPSSEAKLSSGYGCWCRAPCGLRSAVFGSAVPGTKAGRVSAGTGKRAHSNQQMRASVLHASLPGNKSTNNAHMRLRLFAKPDQTLRPGVVDSTVHADSNPRELERPAGKVHVSVLTRQCDENPGSRAPLEALEEPLQQVPKARSRT